MWLFPLIPEHSEEHGQLAFGLLVHQGTFLGHQKITQGGAIRVLLSQ